ncbi:hypothetical protein CapIbe_021788 [Capra ibex]
MEGAHLPGTALFALDSSCFALVPSQPSAPGGRSSPGSARRPPWRLHLPLPRPGPSGVPCGTRDGPPSPCQSPLNLER